MQNSVIAILGCTASGKAELGRALAARIDAEIVSVDSMKVYRGMDIGTAKPSRAQQAATPHWLIDAVDPWEPFSAARFVELADEAILDILGRGKPVVVVGGTVLYFKALYEGLFPGPAAQPELRAEIRRRAAEIGSEALHGELAAVDPVAASRIHPNDIRRIERALEVYQVTGRPISSHQTQWADATLRRPEWNWRLIGLRRPRELANRRINDRVRRMVAAGLVEEARRIWSDPRGVGEQARQSVGYAELSEHFEGRASLEDAIERIKIDSRRLAKQQRTWLRRLPGVTWFELEDNPATDLLNGILTSASPG
ncbi:MAG: tRNA (adenosine(37)-N6)-dimethylallyltransferase MiaA [Planctomycetes bacterium]|nr:tRNA (adenosine(37)-N6)-dimethylallyltransferase MiaA [Planctomycetota bacterium]